MNPTQDLQENNQEFPKRTKLTAWLNIFFALLQFVYSYNSSSQGYYGQGIFFFSIFICLGLGGYFLFEKRSIGKSLTKISGFLCILMLTYFTCRYSPYFFDQKYPFASVLNAIQDGFFLYFPRTIYPIIAGFLILNKPNNELGLR